MSSALSSTNGKITPIEELRVSPPPVEQDVPLPLSRIIGVALSVIGGLTTLFIAFANATQYPISTMVFKLVVITNTHLMVAGLALSVLGLYLIQLSYAGQKASFSWEEQCHQLQKQLDEKEIELRQVKDAFNIWESDPKNSKTNPPPPPPSGQAGSPPSSSSSSGSSVNNGVPRGGQKTFPTPVKDEFIKESNSRRNSKTEGEGGTNGGSKPSSRRHSKVDSGTGIPMPTPLPTSSSSSNGTGTTSKPASRRGSASGVSVDKEKEKEKETPPPSSSTPTPPPPPPGPPLSSVAPKRPSGIPLPTPTTVLRPTSKSDNGASSSSTSGVPSSSTPAASPPPLPSSSSTSRTSIGTATGSVSALRDKIGATIGTPGSTPSASSSSSALQPPSSSSKPTGKTSPTPPPTGDGSSSSSSSSTSVPPTASINSIVARMQAQLAANSNPVQSSNPVIEDVD